MPKLNTYTLATEMPENIRLLAHTPGSNGQFSVVNIPRTVLAEYFQTLGVKGDKGDKGDTGAGLIPRGEWAAGTYQPGSYVSVGSSLWFLRDDAAYASTLPPPQDLDHWMGMDVPSGENGKTPELRVNDGLVQWRYVGDTNWILLAETTTFGMQEATAGEAQAHNVNNKVITPRRFEDSLLGLGIGTKSKVNAVDLNNEDRDSSFSYTSETLNTPVPGQYGRGWTVPSSENYKTQFAINNDGSILYVRYKNGADTWSTWAPLGAGTTDNSNVFLNKGTGAASSTHTFDVSAAGLQRLQVGGALAVQFSNWKPSGTVSELVLELVNGGSAIVTGLDGIRWIRTDGSYTTTFNNSGVTLQASGTDWIYLWSRDGGATIWGKVVR